jgi:hypothetical protein
MYPTILKLFIYPKTTGPFNKQINQRPKHGRQNRPRSSMREGGEP